LGKSNKRVKEQLIRLFGPECFIEKLHLRPPEVMHYEGKAQYKRMKRLTYHHIIEKSKGGQATIENGALLSEENHQWFNKQSRESQAKMNQAFQDYKASFKICCTSLQVTSKGLEVQPLQLADSVDLELPEEIEAGIIEVESMTPEELAYYKEHKRKRNERVYEKFNKLKEGTIDER
jgi:hypothetical protein